MVCYILTSYILTNFALWKLNMEAVADVIWKSYAYTSTYIPNWIGSILWYASNLPFGLIPAESQTLLTSTTEGSELDLFNPRLVPEKSSVSRSIRSLRLSRRTSTDLLDHSTGRRISPLILLTILFGSLSTKKRKLFPKKIALLSGTERPKKHGNQHLRLILAANAGKNSLKTRCPW